MKVIIHTGAHCTDEDRLLKSLLRNADTLRAAGVAVPGPGRYRKLLRDTLTSMRKTAPAEDAREVILDAILDETPGNVRRLVLSNDSFFAAPRLALSGGILYPLAEERLAYLAELFHADEVVMAMGLRDPASFLPALFASSKHTDFAEMLEGAAPEELRWSDLVARIRDAVPGLQMILWCNEDTAFLWADVLRAVGGLAPEAGLEGDFDVASDILTDLGATRLAGYLKEAPPMKPAQRRRVMAAFLDRYADPAKLEEEIDLPGWDEATVARLSAAYEEDVARIAAMPEVRFIRP